MAQDKLSENINKILLKIPNLETETIETFIELLDFLKIKFKKALKDKEP